MNPSSEHIPRVSTRARWWPARRTGRAAAGTGIALTLLAGSTYAATALMDVPAPHDLARLQSTQPSRQGDRFPARTVTTASTTSELPASPQPAPRTVPWKGGSLPFEQFLETTHTNAFVVLQDGKITHEWYADGVTADTRMSSWSMAKSLVSLLVGQAVQRGELSEEDRLVDLLPELRTGGAYDTVTVRHLLDMSSGIDVDENYKPWWPFTGTARMLLTRDLPAFVRDHRSVTYAPGSQATYRSVDTQMLGLVLSRVEGRPLAEILGERLWGPMGATRTATWNLDRDGGTEKAFCCVNATARDFARVGQLVLDRGRAGGRQVIPEQWIDRLSTPTPHSIDGWGYSAQWWHPTGGNGKDFSAIGVYGQYTYVDPVSRTVIVKLSDHGTQQDEQETIDALRSIAHGDA
ncbi:serine hydrolase [Streptomyces sp. NPDC051079]|uniref:serine hydrolase domain-containing protein n=1 Tax=Streptomyces sp. NPDC051079 TaxID=3155043 RepID=UPI00344DCF96